MTQQLNVDPRTVMKKLRFLPVRSCSDFEVFEYDAPDQRAEPPKNSDIGGHHLAFYTDDFSGALDWLRSHDVEILGEPVHRTEGPSAGQSWVYFLAPWGMQFELVSFPRGKGYEKYTDRHLWNPVTPSE